MTPDPNGDWRPRIARRHHLVGWCGLLLFLSLGIVLEALHGFKIGGYLDPGARVRREMWTLAHAHGTLFSLINIAFAAGLPRFGVWTPARLRLTSFLLIDALLLLPLGFFLGGIGHGESDPGIGILLAPLGALLMLLAVGMIAWSATENAPGDGMGERRG